MSKIAFKTGANLSALRYLENKTFLKKGLKGHVATYFQNRNMSTLRQLNCK